MEKFKLKILTSLNLIILELEHLFNSIGMVEDDKKSKAKMEAKRSTVSLRD